MKRLMAVGLVLVVLALGIRVAVNRARAATAPRRTVAPTTQRPAVMDPAVAYQSAKMEVEGTVARSPKDPTLRLRAAEFYMKSGDHAAAIPHLEVASRLQPKQLLPWLALGDAATLSGRFDLARRGYERATAIDARNPLVIRGRGQLLLSQKKFTEARAVLERGLKINPQDVEIRHALGNLYLILNKPVKAVEVLEPAAKSAPQRADLQYLLGDAHERNLHLETAIEHMREAARLDPTMHEAWGRMGLYLVSLTRYGEAREPLQKAISLAPQEPHYHWSLGDSYVLDTSQPAQFDRGLELYRHALKLDAKNSKALYSFAMALTRRGKPEDLKEAVDLFNRLLALNPKDMNVHFKLSETYRRLGDTRKAQEHLAQFQIYFEKGRKQTKHLFRSVSFRDTAEAHLKLGREYLQKGQVELAITSFNLALERKPGLPAAVQGLKEAQARLKSSSSAADR